MRTEELQQAAFDLGVEEHRSSAVQFRQKLPVLVLSIAVFLAFPTISVGEDTKDLPRDSYQFSFLRPEIDAEASVECCPYIGMPTNDTQGLNPPTLIGIGAEKCGSTYLSSLMSMHPKMQMSDYKEMHFLDRSIAGDTLDSALGMYLNRWEANRAIGMNPDDVGSQQIVQFEMTPNYIYIPSAACRAKAFFPNVKFVAVLRDPADRAYSQFTMFRNLCPRDHSLSVVCPYIHQHFYDVIQEGIALLQLRNCTLNTGRPINSWNDCFGCLINDRSISQFCQGRWYLFKEGPQGEHCLDFASDIISRGLYAAQISWWFHLFSPDQFLFLSASDLFEDPVKELNKVADFVGLDTPFTSEMVKARVEKEINKGKYHFNDTFVEEAKNILRDFYRKPNEDLYELLSVNGHSFRRFDSDEEPNPEDDAPNHQDEPPRPQDELVEMLM